MGQFESDAIFDEIHRVNREADASHKRREPLRRRALSGSFSSLGGAPLPSWADVGAHRWLMGLDVALRDDGDVSPALEALRTHPPQGIAGLWDETLSPRDQAQRIATEYPY